MKRLALRMMQTCGLFALSRTMSADMPRILMYHNFCGPEETQTDAVTTAIVRHQFEYLSRHFHVIPLVQLLEQFKHNHQADKPMVAITIDDGRRNFYEFLFPLLQEFKLPATFYVVSSLIRREDWLWTDKVLWLSEQPSAPEELGALKIDDLFRRLNLLRPDVRTRRISDTAEQMKVSIPEQAPAKYAPCSWSELRQMVDSGLVEIGSHTVSHPIFSTLTDEESWYELTESRAQIEEGLGAKVCSFCFPNGKPEDYRLSQVRQVEEAGYMCALVTVPGLVIPGTDVYELPRIGISGRVDLTSFRKHLDGADYYQTRIQTRLTKI